MREFSGMTPEEGVFRLTLLLSRVSLVTDADADSPFACLANVVRDVNDGDIACAVYDMQRLSSRLFTCGERRLGARRVSGDIWKDYIIDLLLFTEHPFARMAAAGEMDRPLFSAMRNELAVLGELAQLSSDSLSRLIVERSKELKLRPHHVKDNIALMSTALWSGGGQKQPAREETPYAAAVPPYSCALPQEGEWVSFKYDPSTAALGVSEHEYVADEALEEIYTKLKRTPVWATLIDELYNLFAAYGTGELLKHRAFMFAHGALRPMRVITPPLPLSFYEAQRVAIMDNTISFMRGDAANNICLYGGTGTGKTYMMLSLLAELPEVRLIALDASAFEDEGGAALDSLLTDISHKPLRFILLLDGLDMQSDGIRAFLRRAELAGLPGNALIYACSREACDSTLFFDSIYFPYPKPQDFSDMVTELISADGFEVNAEDVRSACIDERAASRDCLSLPAAIRVAKRCIEGR